MANDFYFPDEIINDSAFGELQKLIEIEIRALASNPTKGQNIPPNEPSTIRSKKSKGQSLKPLEATGSLLSDVQIVVDQSGIQILVNGYHLYHKKYFGKIMNKGEVFKAINRAIRKWNINK